MTEDGLQFHLRIKRGDVGRYCILPGDPGRCEKIAAHLDDARFVCSNREYTVYTGRLLDTDVSICSTGIGGPSAAIAIEELCNCGADTFIRVGTCGGIALEVRPGDCVIASAATRDEGTSYAYAPAAFPAVADTEVMFSLIRAAEKLGYQYHTGIVHCKDSFYGQHKPEQMPVAEALLERWNEYKKLGVLASEMESAALFTVAAYREVRCGTVLHVIWNQERKAKGINDVSVADTEHAIDVCIEALKILIRKDYDV